MKLTSKNREAKGSHLNFQQTNTTKEGFTTFAKTGNKEVDHALRLLEDGLSGVYYHVLENDYVGENPLDFGVGYLDAGLQALKELQSE